MFLDNFKQQIFTICEVNHVKTLFVFGSVLTTQFKQNSDIDFWVDINDSDPLIYADSYFNLKFSLEDLLQKPVDLLETNTLQNPYLKQSIDKTKIVFHEQ